MKSETIIKLITLIIVIIGVAVLVYNIASDATRDMIGINYTSEDFREYEKIHCAQFGMEAVRYIAEQCSLFGCHKYDATKCVDGTNEKMVDYEDPLFCKLTVKNDMGWC